MASPQLQRWQQGQGQLLLPREWLWQLVGQAMMVSETSTAGWASCKRGTDGTLPLSLWPPLLGEEGRGQALLEAALSFTPLSLLSTLSRLPLERDICCIVDTHTQRGWHVVCSLLEHGVFSLLH